MAVSTVVRIGIQTFANVTLGVAICLTLAAMFTAQWQIADFGNGEIEEHGLYKDCQKAQEQKSGIKTKNEWLCFFKFDQKNHEVNTRIKASELKDWHVTSLALLGTSCVLALLAIVCSLITYCLKWFTVPWAILSFLAAILSLAGLINFLRWSTESQNRIFHLLDQRVEAIYGSSLSIAIAGCVLYFVATILAGVAIGMVAMDGRRGYQQGVRSGSNGHTTKV